MYRIIRGCRGGRHRRPILPTEQQRQPQPKRPRKGIMNSYRISVLFTITVISTHTVAGKDCGFPGRPGNGTTIGAEKFFYPGEEVTFECDNGYILFGGDRRICQEDGSWSGSLPECKFNMALMKAATQSETLWNYDPNLAVDGDSNTCSFTPQSDVQRWWQVHLSGSPRVGSVAITMSPGSYQHFTIFVVQLLEGNKAMYKPCAEFKGRFQEQKVFFKCKEGHSGQFVYIRDDRPDKEYFGLCEVEVFHYKETPECGEPEKPIYGIVKVRGEAAHYNCIPGYIRSGNSTRTCTWSGWRPVPVPECIEVQCDHPPPIKDGFIEVANFKDNYIYGSKATYHCNPGFILWGNATRLCDANGRWTGSEPKCQPIACGDPVTFPHTTVALINGSTSWKAVAQFSCIFGYQPFNGNRSTTIESQCLQNGSWTPVELNCVPNQDLLALDPRNRGLGGRDSGTYGKSGDDFLVGLTASNVHTTVSTPVLLVFVVIITVIIGTALTSIVLLVRNWYQKITDYTPQHFILSTHQPNFKDSSSGPTSVAMARHMAVSESNNYATMPVSYKAHKHEGSSNDSSEHLQQSPRQRFGSGSLHYGGSLPRRLLRQNTTSTVASASASNSNSANQSSCGFKYAEAHEIATATLRHGCLQPTQPQTTASLQTLPHHYANFANLSSSSRRSGLNHQQQEHQAASIVPDIIQQAASDSEAEVDTNSSSEAGSADRHVIVNQLLTFLTEKQQKHQLIDLSSEATTNTASTTSTLRLTDPQ